MPFYVLSLVGSSAIGLMWGWLWAPRVVSSNSRWITVLGFLVTTILLGSEVAWLATYSALIGWTGGIVFAATTVLIWRQRLATQRYGPSQTQ